MGSIPATLDILVSNVRYCINKTSRLKFYSKSFKTNFSHMFHARRRNKSPHNVFFSYWTLSLLFRCYQDVQSRSFNWNLSQLRTHQFLSYICLLKWFGCKRKTPLVKPISTVMNFRALCNSLTLTKLNPYYRNYMTKASEFTEITGPFAQFYGTHVLNCLQAYVDKVNFTFMLSNFRTLTNKLQCLNHENWFLDTLFSTWILLNKNVQDFNLSAKRQFRQYFKFYNYWFEYSRLALVSYSAVTVSNSIFSLNSIGLKRLPYVNFRSMRLGFRDTIAQLPQSLLRHTVSESLIRSKRLLAKSSLSHYFDIPPLPTTLSQSRDVRRRNVPSNLDITFSNRRFNPLPHYNLRHIVWNRKQQNYLFKNKRWKCRLRTNRTYVVSFRWSRKFRHQTIYRKFIPKILRSLVMSTHFGVNIAYNSLIFTQPLSHILTRDSASHSYVSPHYSHLRQTLSLYTVLSDCARQAIVSLLSEYHVAQTQRSFTLNRLSSTVNQNLIVEPYILQFTSFKFFMSLLMHSTLVMWKYSVAFPSLTSSSRILLYSVTQSLKSISQTLSYVVQTQAYGYNATSLLRYTTYSNLSLLKLHEYPKLVPVNKFIDSKVIQYYSSRYLRPNGFFWYYTALIQFLEDTTGRKVALNFGPFLETALTFSDRARCLMWGSRIAGFKRILGPKIFIYEALDVLVTSIRLKDPTFLANWIRAMLLRMSFWKYRLLFRYLKFLLHNLIKSSFDYFSFKGAKFRLKGKISVAGNARTRMIFYRVGLTTHTTMANRVSYDLSYVNTFTGIQGFKIWFFY